MHGWGINLRYLGRVRWELHKLYNQEHLDTKNVEYLESSFKKGLDLLLLTEMSARVVKDIFYEEMRKKVHRVKVLSEEPYHQLAIKLFNLIIGNPQQAPTANAFWHSVGVLDKETKLAQEVRPHFASLFWIYLNFFA